MGYQLYCVRLCGVAEDAGGPGTGVVGVRPNAHSPPVPVIPAAAAAASFATSGIVPVHAVHFWLGEVPTVALQVGAVAVEVTPPEALRSAGSCSSRIALGVMGLLWGVVGGVKPRANPSANHSLVTGFQLPFTSLYSTRR